MQEQIDKDGTSVEEKRRLEALMPSKLMALTYLEDPSSAPTQGRMDLGNGFAAYVRDYDEAAAEKLLADAQYDVGRVLYAAQQGQLHNLDFIKHPENYIRGAADADEPPIWVKRVSSETRDAAVEKSYLEAQR